MLLSMYVSYLWAEHSKDAYILGMVVFILLISFLPAFCPLGIFTGVTFPVTFLSFPFYAYSLRTPPWVIHRGISFLAVDIIHSTEYSWGDFFPFVPFPFFLFVNILGALLGYWIGTKHRRQFFSSKWWKVLWGVVGVASIGFVLGAWEHIGWRVGYAIFGFGIVVLETIILSYSLNKWTSITSIIEYENQAR